jgi:ribosome-associated heat shock protein Hsp15
VRVNSARVTKPAASVGAGDVLTFAQGRQIRVIRVEAAGMRRGPAPEAQALYTDLTPVPDPCEPPPVRKGPRPTKKHRRDYEESRRPPLE